MVYVDADGKDIENRRIYRNCGEEEHRGSVQY